MGLVRESRLSKRRSMTCRVRGRVVNNWGHGLDLQLDTMAQLGRLHIVLRTVTTVGTQAF